MHSRCCPAGSHAKRGGAGREWRCGPALGGSLCHMGPTSSEIRITGHPGRNRTAGAALSIPDVIVAIEVLRAPYGESRDMHGVLATFRRCLSTPLRGTVSTPRAQRTPSFLVYVSVGNARDGLEFREEKNKTSVPSVPSVFNPRGVADAAGHIHENLYCQ